MILLPNWGVTRRVMESYVPFVALALLYLYFFVSSITPETLALFTPRLANITQLFADERAVALRVDSFCGGGFVCRSLDLLGRAANGYLDNSLACCLFVCLPLRIALSYLDSLA